MNSKGVFTALIAMMVLSIVIGNFYFIQIRNSDLSVNVLHASSENVRKDWITSRTIYGLVSADAMADLSRITCTNATDYFAQIQGYYDVTNSFLLNNYEVNCQALVSKNLMRDKGVASPDKVESGKDFYVVLTCQRKGVEFTDSFRVRKLVQPTGVAGNCTVDVSDVIGGVVDIDE